MRGIAQTGQERAIAALPEGDWQLVKSEVTPEGQFYIGKAEVCTFEFSFLPEEIPGVPTIAGLVASALRSAIQQEQGHLLSYRLYLDRAEWYRSRWLCIVTAHASPLAWYWIVAIIAAAIAALAYLIHEIKSVPYIGPAIVLIGVGVAAGGIATLLKRAER